MATTTTPPRRTRFSRRIPDHVTDELVNVLSQPKIFEFNALFALVYENLKKRNAVSGGEEMLRLRAYEKLQNLVSRNLVAKAGKTYRGLEGIKSASSANQPKPTLTPALAAAKAQMIATVTAELEAEERAAAAAAAEVNRLSTVAAAPKVVAAAPRLTVIDGSAKGTAKPAVSKALKVVADKAPAKAALAKAKTAPKTTVAKAPVKTAKPKAKARVAR